MSYWPPQEQGDQENWADALTENLSGVQPLSDSQFDSPAFLRFQNVHGTWSPLYEILWNMPAMGLRTITQAPKMFRETALEVQDNNLWSPSGLTMTGWIFNRITGILGPNQPINLSGYSTMQFYVGGTDKTYPGSILVPHVPCLTGKGWVQLRCTDGNYAEKEFYYTPNKGSLEPQTLFLNEFSVDVQPFNWSSIGYIVIILEILNQNAWGGRYRAWLDGGPFFYRETQNWAAEFHSYEGTDRTHDIGRRITVTEPNGAYNTYSTPFTVSLPQNGNDVYVIAADNSSGRFLRWEGTTGTKDTPTFEYLPVSNEMFAAIYSPLVQTTLNVAAKDENNVPLFKLLKLGGLSPQKTPFSYQVNPGSYQLQVMDTTGFLRWSDGNTDNPRTFSVGTTPVTMTAIYAAGTDPGEPTSGGLSVTAALAVIFGLTGTGVAGYYLYKKTRKRK